MFMFITSINLFLIGVFMVMLYYVKQTSILNEKKYEIQASTKEEEIDQYYGQSITTIV